MEFKKLDVSSTPPIPAVMVLGAVVSQVALNFFLPYASNFLGFALATVIVWLARFQYIPALIILQLSSSNFILEGYGTEIHLAANFEANAVFIAGFPVTVTYALLVAMVARVGFELLRRPGFVPSKRWGALVIGWLIAMPLSALMCWYGRSEGNLTWTLPLRAGMLTSAFFYGMILARTARPDTDLLEKWLVPIAAGAYILASMAFFHHRILWFMAGAVPPMAILAFKRGGIWRIIGGISVVACGYYSFGFGRSVRDLDAVGGVLGSGGATFTLNALFIVATLISLWLHVVPARLRPITATVAGLPAFLFVIAFSFTVAAQGTLTESAGFAGSEIDSLSVVERAKAKLFADRAVLWNAAWHEIKTPPHVVKPSGRPLDISHPRWGLVQWHAGAHNTFLEQLRINGLLAGTIYLTFILAAMAGASRSFRQHGFGPVQAVAVAVLTNALVGATTGDYIATDTVAILFFLFGGVVLIWSKQELLQKTRTNGAILQRRGDHR